ncbi:MAG TPA: ATP-grasp domain-containing protein [Rhizomicrobium sp.]|jgi:hypothetical protein
MPATVLLLSSVGWPSVARLAGGFAHAGARVEALAPANAAVIRSRYLSHWHPYRALSPLRSVETAIARAAPDLLVCCDDRAVAQVLVLYDRLRAKSSVAADAAVLIERSLGDPLAYARLIGRNGFMAEAKAEGIRVPKTMAVAGKKDLEQAMAELGFPFVLKTDGSWGGEGVVAVHGAQAAHAAFARLSRTPSRLRNLARSLKRRDAHYLLESFSRIAPVVSAQRFVAGRPAASAFAAWQGRIEADIYYDVLVADGTIGPPNVIRRIEDPAMRDASQKVARRFGLSGIHGMDFIRDADGVPWLIEINPRVTQGSTLAFGRGADLPSALTAHFVPEAGMRPAIVKELVALFPREWQRNPDSPYLFLAHHDVPWDDPAALYASLGVKPPKHQSRVPLASPGASRRAPSLVAVGGTRIDHS